MPTLTDIRAKVSALEGLDDASAIEYIRRAYYPDRRTEEIAAKLGYTPPPPPQEPRGMLRAAADTGLSFGQGAVQGVRMLSDVAGADNAVSGALRTVEDYIGGLKSAQAKQDQQTVAAILKDAEGKGILDQVIAGAKAFGVAPVQTIAQAAGTSLPTIGAALLTGGTAPAAMLAARAAPLVMGAAQGVGAVKGSIFDEVQRELLERRATPEEARAIATKAQEYGGDNAMQLALGGALGAWAGKSGIEGAIGRLTQGTTKAVPGMATRVGMGAVAEGIPEAAQGGQEKFATNAALTNAGIPTDPWSGVVAGATMEGLAGSAMGGAFGVPTPAQRPGDQLRAEGLQPERGPLTRGLNAAVETAAKKVDAGAPVPSDAEINGEAPVALSQPAPPAEPVAVIDYPALDPRAQREADRPADPTGEILAGDITTKSGGPFKNNTAAMRALDRAGDGFELASVTGGVVIRKKADGQPVGDAQPGVADLGPVQRDSGVAGQPAEQPGNQADARTAVDGAEPRGDAAGVQPRGDGAASLLSDDAPAPALEPAPAPPAAAELPMGQPEGGAARVLTIGGKPYTLTPEQRTELETVEADFKTKFDANREQYERTKNYPTTKDPDVGLRSAKELFDNEQKALGFKLSAERRRIAGALTTKEQQAQAEKDGRVRPGDTVQTAQGEGTVTGLQFGNVRVQIGNKLATFKRAEVQKVQSKIKAVAPESIGGGVSQSGPAVDTKQPVATAPNAVMPAGLTVTFGGKTYPVESVADAQQKWTDFRDRAGVGVSEVGNGVRVTDGAGRFVARISYNGRTWDTEDDGKGGGNVIAEPAEAVAAPTPSTPKERRAKVIEAKAAEAKQAAPDQPQAQGAADALEGAGASRPTPADPTPAPAPQPTSEPTPERKALEQRLSNLEALKKCLAS